MYLYISVNCTGSSFTCDFAFDVKFSLHTFEEMIKHEIGLMDPQNPILTQKNNATYTFFKLSDVKLTQWSQHNCAYDIHPYWNMQMTIFNKVHNVNFRTRQYELSNSFHVFFVTWLKHLF